MARLVDNPKLTQAQRNFILSCDKSHTPLKIILLCLAINFIVIDTGLILATHGVRPTLLAPYPYLMNLARCGVAFYVTLTTIFLAMGVGQTFYFAEMAKEGDLARIVPYLRDHILARYTERPPIGVMIYVCSRLTMLLFLVGLALDGWVITLLFYVVILLLNWFFNIAIRQTTEEAILKLTDEQVNVQ
jgi:hypothetical protein